MKYIFNTHCRPAISDADKLLPAEKLLSIVWRSPGSYNQIGALGKQQHSQFRNIPVATIGEAVQKAFDLSVQGSETYFACAEYITQETRKAENAAGAWAFWLDIDCGEDKAAKGKGYSTVEEAQQAIRKFCEVAGLPLPTHIVDSGGGLHAYWALDTRLEKAVWQQYAKKLKAIAAFYRFLADPARTADIASVLRIPGTLNHKYDPPRRVELIHAADSYIETAIMLGAIDAAQIPKSKPCPRQTPGRDRYQPDEAPNPNSIEKLAALLECLDPDMGYDDWCRVGMALYNETHGSDEGLTLFDSWSSGGDKYKGARETSKKWGSFKLDHPNPLKIGTLIFMVNATGMGSAAIMAAFEDQFEVVITEGEA